MLLCKWVEKFFSIDVNHKYNVMLLNVEQLKGFWHCKKIFIVKIIKKTLCGAIAWQRCHAIALYSYKLYGYNLLCLN